MYAQVRVVGSFKSKVSFAKSPTKEMSVDICTIEGYADMSVCLLISCSNDVRLLILCRNECMFTHFM